MRLAARVARLERDPALRPPPAPCPECGHGDGVATRWAFTFVDTDEESPSKWCGTCGMQLVYGMEFDRKG